MFTYPKSKEACQGSKSWWNVIGYWIYGSEKGTVCRSGTHLKPSIPGMKKNNKEFGQKEMRRCSGSSTFEFLDQQKESQQHSRTDKRPIKRLSRPKRVCMERAGEQLAAFDLQWFKFPAAASSGTSLHVAVTAARPQAALPHVRP